MATIKKVVVKATAKKAKTGGSFPDLNKDGKITKADILKGRGVIAKKGAKLSKAAYEKSAYDKKMDASGAHGKEGSAKDMKADKAAMMKKGGKVAKKKVGMHKMPDGSMMKNSMMKKGGKVTKMKKCAYGCK